jgi:hypothetical protein
VSTTEKIDIEDFARRTERLCDFFLAKIEEQIGKNESGDLKVIEDLKEEAANIQFLYIHGRLGAAETVSGLHDYMNGV